MPNRTAADMMTRAIVTLSPDTDIGVAIRCLLRNRITGAPVVDVTGRLVGILSEKDCLRVFVEEEGDKPSARAVADYMSTPKAKASILPTTNLYDIVNLFLNTPFRRLPVLDSNRRLVGQVARADAMRAIESIHDNSYLYGSPAVEPISTSFDDGMGVDSAMRIARAQRTVRRSRTLGGDPRRDSSGD